MWIPLGARWDQEPAGSLVWYLHPKKLQGPWQERGKERGERRKEGKLACAPFFFVCLFFFFNVFAPHEDSAKLARGRQGTAHPSKRLGWAVQVEYVSGL